MKNIHLVITDLFLPKEFAAEVCAGLRLPALEKMLARGALTGAAHAGEGASLENLLCEMFGAPHQTGAPVAPVSAAFDRLPVNRAAGEYWLRADPVHLRLQREQLVLLPHPDIGADEAAQMCASLNRHFAGQGMAFFAPHPQRWYMRLDSMPDVETVPLSRAAGRNVHDLLPGGAGAVRWHQVFNEIQMLLFAHPVNEAREARGALPVNSVWLWGGGSALSAPLAKNYQHVNADEVMAEMFAAAADIPFSGWPGQWRDDEINNGGQLLVCNGLRLALQRGDLAAWRDAVQAFETGYAQPLWQALRSGKIAQLQIDVLGGDAVRRTLLGRADAWAFWRSVQPLGKYASM